MRRTSLAALLAAPILLMSPANLPANPPKQCYAPYSCGACMGFFSKLHQHGPLFNYGPYYGYPPFEPYGPWNAYLQYNPWYYGTGGGSGGHGHGGLFHGRCAGDGCGHFHKNWLHGGWFRGHGCLSCGSHGLFNGGLFGGHGCKSCGKVHADGCSTCTADAGTTDPLTRFAGAGSPKDYAGFYSALPSLAEVTPAGGTR